MSEVIRFEADGQYVFESHDGDYVLASDFDRLEAENKALKGELEKILERHGKLQLAAEALRSRAVVVPKRATITKSWNSRADAEAKGWNACLDELARLNGKTVSEELLYRIADTFDDTCHGSAIEKELRALLDEGTQH